MTHIKAILFDLDNTLIDFINMKRKSCEAAVDSMIKAGFDMKKEKALKIIFELYDFYGIEYQKIFEKFLMKTKGKVNYKILIHGILAYRKTRDYYLKPYPNAISTLLQLKKKYKLAIISDAPRIEAWLRLVSMKMEDFFDVVITSGDVRKQKTSLTPFKAALKALNIKPEEAMMVGDRIPRDINTPKNLGIKTCYARYGDFRAPPKGKSGADFEINDIKEILKVVK